MSYTITTRKTWAATMSDLEHEFDKWGVTDWETNYPKGARSQAWNQLEDDRTVSLHFKKNGKEVKLTYGKQNRAVDNLRALYLTINDMRMTEVRGVSDLVEASYKQLNSGISTSPYDVLGLTENCTLQEAERAYHDIARIYHPDNHETGSSNMMNQINNAIAQIRLEKI